MNREVSCGAVVFTRIDGEIRYVIIRGLRSRHGFPKGHIEKGETERETALREIWEETGLRVTFLEGFRAEEQYPLMREGKPETLKRVIYFLAEYENQTPTPQATEIAAIMLLPYEEALKRIEYSSGRRILAKAERYLAALDAGKV